MTARANERIAYFNGSYVPESQVRVPFRDRSWVFGDGAFDMTRTFNGRLFKIREHVERLYRSLKVLRIDPGLSPAEMIGISEEVNGRNLHLLGPDEDQWVGQRISRGVNRVDGDNWDHYGPTVIVELMPLPFKARARLYRDGIDVVVPSVRRVSPDALTPRAKIWLSRFRRLVKTLMKFAHGKDWSVECLGSLNVKPATLRILQASKKAADIQKNAILVPLLNGAHYVRNQEILDAFCVKAHRETRARLVIEFSSLGFLPRSGINSLFFGVEQPERGVIV